MCVIWPPVQQKTTYDLKVGHRRLYSVALDKYIRGMFQRETPGGRWWKPKWIGVPSCMWDKGLKCNEELEPGEWCSLALWFLYPY